MAKGIKTGGRKVGTPNKLSTTVKDNVIAVFDQIGGQEAMAEWAKENRTEFYRLYSKLLPHQVNAEINKSMNASDLSDDDLAWFIANSKIAKSPSSPH